MKINNWLSWLLIIVGCVYVSICGYMIWTAWEVING